MAPHQVPPGIIDFYTSGYDESARLSKNADGVLELVRTQELLRRHLPPAPAKVLDVGGGPGAHARWLVEAGYEVHLVDPVERHVQEALETGATAERADARELPAGDATCDAVLLLGPLYHLTDPADRKAALAEARRVVRPGGPVAAAGINRYAPLFEHTAYAHLHHPVIGESIAESLATGVYDGRRGFTEAYFHTPEELAGELRDSGCEDTVVYGIEGPAWSLLKATEQHTGESLVGSPLFESALAAARLAEAHPELLAASSHLLAVGCHP